MRQRRVPPPPRFSRRGSVMSDLDDTWYVRLPNGRVLRAKGTQEVRNSLHAGHIPASCQVRRAPDEEWLGMEWVEEFADLAHRRAAHGNPDRRRARRARTPKPTINLEASSIAARLDPRRLPTAGVRGMLQELLAALDRTLVRGKLGVGLFAGLIAGLIAAVLQSGWLSPAWLSWVVAGPLLLVVAAVTAGILTQGTYVELSKMRPAKWKESTARLGGLAFRICVLLLLVGGGALLVIGGLRWLTLALGEMSDLGWPAGLQEGLTATAAGAALLVEVLVWPVVAFALLLPAVLVAEECGVVPALGHWLRLLRHHLPRVWLYEVLALGLGLVFAGLLSLPLIVAAASGVGGERIAFVFQVLAGVVGGGLFAF